MAHKRKDTYVPGEWAKHLKPTGKRQMAKAERRAVKRRISDEEKELAKWKKLTNHSNPWIAAIACARVVGDKA